MTQTERPAPADLDAILERVESAYRDCLVTRPIHECADALFTDAKMLVAEVRALQQELHDSESKRIQETLGTVDFLALPAEPDGWGPACARWTRFEVLRGM